MAVGDCIFNDTTAYFVAHVVNYTCSSLYFNLTGVCLASKKTTTSSCRHMFCDNRQTLQSEELLLQ